jgi:TM2 domain-containing membrane protein YozV
MSGAWRKLDLAGGGLQEANRELARTLRRRGIAYLLWLLFPTGAHRFYLGEALGGVAYVAGTGAAVACAVAGWNVTALVASALLVSLAVFDLWWIDRRLTKVNKHLRMRAYLRPGPGVPSGFKGRLVDPPEAPGSRPPSFHEQEQLLTHIERARRDRA